MKAPRYRRLMYDIVGSYTTFRQTEGYSSELTKQSMEGLLAGLAAVSQACCFILLDVRQRFEEKRWGTPAGQHRVGKGAACQCVQSLRSASCHAHHNAMYVGRHARHCVPYVARHSAVRRAVRHCPRVTNGHCTPAGIVREGWGAHRVQAEGEEP